MLRSLGGAGLDPSLVLDIGANRGQFAAAALHRWPTARVVSFEPLDGPAASLRAIADPRLTGHQVALGRMEGRIDIHEHPYSVSSSVLRSIDPHGTDTSVRTVPMRTLDASLASTSLDPESVLLKLDVQGYELEVLAGATKSLASVDALVIEQAFIATYEGQPLFGDVHGKLQQLGFSLDRLVDWRRVAGQVIEVDCLYLRH